MFRVHVDKGQASTSLYLCPTAKGAPLPNDRAPSDDYVRTFQVEGPQIEGTILYNVNFKNDKWDVIGGMNMTQFRCNHFGKLKYVSNVGQVEDYTGYKYYDSDARKDDYSVFAKATYHVFDFFDVFGDIQYRHVFYKTNGLNDRFYENDNSHQILDIHKNYDFWNPKAGLKSCPFPICL